MLRRVAITADFRHATWGPRRASGKLYASAPFLSQPWRDRHARRCSACVGLVADDYNSLSLRCRTTTTTRTGSAPRRSPSRSARADACLAELVEAAGGSIRSWRRHRRRRSRADAGRAGPLPLAELLGGGVAHAGTETVRPRHPRARREPDRPRRCRASTCSPRARGGSAPTPGCARCSAESRGLTSPRGSPGRRPRRWSRGAVKSFASSPGPPPPTSGARPGFEGDLLARWSTASDAPISGESYPDALGRLWAALAVHARDILISAAPGWGGCVDWAASAQLARTAPRVTRGRRTRSARCSPWASSRRHCEAGSNGGWADVQTWYSPTSLRCTGKTGSAKCRVCQGGAVDHAEEAP